MKRVLIFVTAIALLLSVIVYLFTGNKNSPVKIGIIDSCLNATTQVNYSINETFRLKTNAKENHGDMVVGVLTKQIADYQLYYACVLDEVGIGDINDIVSAIDWLRERSVNVVCMSFTTMKDSPLLREAIAGLINDGVIVVSTCLNYSDIETYPAAYPGVISVANCSSKNAVISITSKEIKQRLLGYEWNDCSTSALSAYISGKIAAAISTRTFDKDLFVKEYDGE